MLRPLRNRVIVERNENEESTKSGIIITDSSKERPSQGKIIAVGPGRLRESGELQPMSVEVGEEVYFSKYAGEEVEYEGNKYLILDDDDILAVIE
ncbi:10 kDa chaperonin [Phocicoccus schoeneichii]|uniref:Co-chaperonin GroES n=1 Tax=Phocicoccus schoeneichii TaxID=1812261 RepID=A0A6V7RNL9_9BACL|nr:co-chaperone GroES [Jeotgalicoccus schoeneichii]GGH55873.1 10 kDa chaperonin [Jeotgalicoccus schoeneichii]CAD2079307.1 10 kDa chaperonin [Jeotgalicoccus schoeneichii]